MVDGIADLSDSVVVFIFVKEPVVLFPDWLLSGHIVALPRKSAYFSRVGLVTNLSQEPFHLVVGLPCLLLF